MQSLFYLFIFLLGLAIGSFLNCVIYRLEEGKSFLRGRSFCPHCKHSLSWQDLIPLFSFLILRAKCRYCQQKISWQYPLVELATGLLFVLLFWEFGLILDFGFWILISCFLLVIFVYDLKHYIIPDRVVFPAMAIAAIYNVWRSDLPIIDIWKSDLFASAIGAAGFFLAIVLISKGKWMGIGDIKLAFLMGLILGFPNILVALFLAFFMGAIIGTGLIILKKKGLKSEVPFGPFLIAGLFLALFSGNEIISWYLNLIW